MTDPIAFLLAALALLAMPGPTNTLLATSGTAVGFRRSLRLIPAEMAGYLGSVTTLALVAPPLVRQLPWAALALKAVCALYLARLACGLWCGRAAADGHPDGPVGARQVLVATLLNPKGLVFAFVILPHLAEGRIAQALPYGMALLALIATVAMGWIGLGSLARAGLGSRLHPRVARRCCAATMAAFALALSGSALAALL